MRKGRRGSKKNTEIIGAGGKRGVESLEETLEEKGRGVCEIPFDFFRVSGRVLSLAVKSPGYMYMVVV